jgi:acyl-homoserine-lactone acylase
MRALLFPLLLLLAAASPPELARGKAQAQDVTITRDDWGIAHIHGKTDADAVFGMIYAQAEDDFPRIEANYLTALGRKAEAEGERAIWEDLRARLYVSEPELKANYEQSPAPMRRLMDSWAAGLNYFLATHPNVKPRVLKRFEPWMALSFTEGSIGGDIERIDLKQLESFYSNSRHPELVSGSIKSPAVRSPDWMLKHVQHDGGGDNERQNSNGIAIAPPLTVNKAALLLINPHTSFFFRSEQQVSSDEGLNAYGAATWGQFFIYQGFNAHAGWMHTSSGVDVVDEFAETIQRKGSGYCYRYASTCRPLVARSVTIRYRAADGKLASRSFTTWRTHRGPIVRSEGERWIAFAMMDRPVEALQQSFLRTKMPDLASFMRVAQLKANSSNNTIFADDKGAIAYLHPQFVPLRNDRFDYTKPVDGSDPATDWGSLHSLAELPNVINPPTGWVQNTNSWPYRAAGEFSAKAVNYPKYMDMFGPNFREQHALKLLMGSRDWTLEKLNAAAYDSHQPGFAALIPPLIQAYDALAKNDPRRASLAEPVAVLRAWDFRWSAGSVAQSLAVVWVETVKSAVREPIGEPSNKKFMRLARDSTPAQKLEALGKAVEQLQRDFGRWQVPWGEINRFQRVSGAIAQPFSDAAPSIPVPFANGNYGSLAAFRAVPKNGSKRWYEEHGNTFVAIVEFGRRVRAKAVREGGQSGDPASPHFNDQAGRYASGALRDVYFYPDQLKGHIERTYRPGE